MYESVAQVTLITMIVKCLVLIINYSVYPICTVFEIKVLFCAHWAHWFIKRAPGSLSMHSPCI